jgi:hypothetical protein
LEEELYLKLPCKLGAEIYSVGSFFEINEKMDRIIKHKVVVEHFKLSMFDEIGTKYFLTYKEAENKVNTISDFIYNKKFGRFYTKDGIPIAKI